MIAARKTTHLPPRTASTLSHGCMFSPEIGRPLTHMVSLNYGHTCCEAEDMTKTFQRLLKGFFGKWFTRHPTRRHLSVAERAATFVWVAEGHPLGHHRIHWFVHIPPALFLEFERELERWLQKTAGPILDPKAIHIRTIKGLRYARNYALKGLRKGHADLYGIEAKSQGVVYGKRCGVSENLGPTAIARHRARLATTAPRMVG